MRPALHATGLVESKPQGYAAAAAAAKSLQSCPTLCDPIDGSPHARMVNSPEKVRTKS